MWFLSSVGPCAGCGEWAGGAVICPRCGRARTRERVALVDAAVDGRWIAAWSGSAVAVAAELAAFELPSRALAGRVGAARRLLASLGDEQVRLHLDLRQPEAGLLVSSVRRGHFQHKRWLLPWLVLRAGPRELRITRYAHAKLQRRFDAGQLVQQAAQSTFDELTVVGPTGAARRPLPSLTGALEVPSLDPASPPPRPLPATAPGAGAVQRAAWGQGALSSVVLCGLAPWLLWVLAGVGLAGAGVEAQTLEALRGHPRPERFAEVLAGPLPSAQALAREACLAEDAWQRRHGLLLAARVLPPSEARRYLAWLAQHDPAVEVRLLAVDLLGDAGDAGRTLLAQLHQDPTAPLAVRAQAHRRLVDRRDPRALELAKAGLDRGGPAELHRVWARALVAAAPADLRRWVDHADPHVRAAAEWALRRASRK